ncbi:MAG: hypothetical protein MRZ33_02210, partial [Prevotella sp.]|nr:hypothetical protein [Prevotella sp.]
GSLVQVHLEAPFKKPRKFSLVRLFLLGGAAVSAAPTKLLAHFLLGWCSGDCSLVIFCIKVLFFYG